ncbi:MAG: diaminopimelate decarboxylase [Lachnospiraceae bacterium]|nr:diaminopimelate decarboxylase [Lachnospiraceae bacterium]MBR0305390.1 diaminopimelate decarboxylase [Lachnospiraceae bacterium]
MICNNITVENGILYFAGQDTTKLAAQYGTPLYLMDEDKIREKCRAYKHAFEKHFGPSAQPLYASKACCFKRIYEIMREEGMGIDVVSSGEIYTALKAGFDLSQAYFHSNNKTDEDIRFAIENGIGYFVADNEEEVKAVEAEAARKGIRQKLLLRLTPGIDPHTYEAVATGKVDSKFGTAIETGQAAEIVKFTLEQPHVELMGFHCHVGSQVFEEDIFERAAVVMLEFIAEMKEKLGFTAPMLDLGGGYGVRYVDTDPYLDIETKVADVAAAIKEACARLGIDVPEIHMEPGRSIVADAGMTLYTVGTVKKIPGYKNYVSIDGGMGDNPRFALYGSKYTCFIANKMDEICDFKCDLVGRCCESGDIIQEHIVVPSSVGRGDIAAVCTTGAYNYTMASNYNRLGRPPVVMLSGGESYVAVRRESFEDLIRNDI